MPELAAHDICKTFGGIIALKDASLTLRPGEVHGLIGPNGSGKTTLLNMLSGYYRVNSGRITLDGAEIMPSSVQDRSSLGIARTFQKPRLLPTISVLDNAMLGAWRDVGSGFVATALALPGCRHEEGRIRDRARELLHGVGLGAVMDRRANLLEHAQQKFLEIARALALRPRFLLLDEPAGGLTGAEINLLGQIISRISAAGIGILIVEHHTDFVFRTCSRVTALDRGVVIRTGTAEDVWRDAKVIEVYLGA